jgi:predicted PurR-regulated permease PerM
MFAVFLILAWQLENVATLLILSFLFAYVLNPLVTLLARLRFVNRTFATVLVLIGLILLFLAILFIIIPEVVQELRLFVSRLPGYLAQLKTSAVPWVEREFGLTVPLSIEGAVEKFGKEINHMAPKVIGPATSVVAGLFGGTFSVVAKAAAVVMFPMFLFFLLKDFPAIVSTVDDLVPIRNKENYTAILKECDKSLSAFLHGQFMVMLVLGTLYSVGYSIVGVPVALGLGLFTGVLCFIPYVGAATGFALALLMSLLAARGVGDVVGVVIVFGSVQLLDAVLITPRIIGGQLGLSPLWIVIALMAGGELFGFMGVLLAVPTTAVVKVLVAHSVEKYKQSILYRDSIAPPIKAPSNSDES